MDEERAKGILDELERMVRGLRRTSEGERFVYERLNGILQSRFSIEPSDNQLGKDREVLSEAVGFLASLALSETREDLDSSLAILGEVTGSGFKNVEIFSPSDGIGYELRQELPSISDDKDIREFVDEVSLDDDAEFDSKYEPPSARGPRR